ncbi:hypothetical protein [Paracoccus siganidrum]|nr:hypothetical protein [Paracoccus siganidrum]RMC38259.1 hypothetical protein C9E82_07360 [Paracoccus siganidrum]
MTYAAFLSAVLALLLAPGPTNTLMGLAGAQRGLGRVARLLPAELLGYLTTILPLVFLGGALLAEWPVAAVLLKIAAAIWVMVLAVRLWGLRRDDGAGGEVGAGKVWLTTVLNPKALIFGLVLLPGPEEAQFLPRLGLFLMMVVAVALVWGAAGAMSRMGGGRRLHLVQRGASLWLALVSITLIAGVIRA